MKSAAERRVTRNRLYTLVGGIVIILLGVGALISFRGVAERRLQAEVYRYPYKTLKALAEAQERFFLHDLDGDGRRDYAASLEELDEAGCITDRLAAGEVAGYRYEAVAPPPGGAWAMCAIPLHEPETSLHYYVDPAHVVRAERGRPADVESTIYWHPLHGRLWDGPDEEPALP